MPLGFSDQERAYYRLKHILTAIGDIDGMLGGKGLADLEKDRIARAAYERFLEIICKASRHVTPELKAETPEVRWREIADLGNRLRHAYDRLNLGILWEIYAKGHLATLRVAVERLKWQIEASQ